VVNPRILDEAQDKENSWGWTRLGWGLGAIKNMATQKYRQYTR